MRVLAQSIGRDYALYNADSVEALAGLPDASVHLTVSSPPFASLFTYNPSERDVGNSRTPEEFGRHFGYILEHLYRVTAAGRLCCLHVAQIAAMLERDGYIGLKDFRGDVIRLAQSKGWIYHGEYTIQKNPQAQAVRTKAKGLLFVQLHKDAAWSRPCLADYIVILRKPGENAVPVHPDVTNEEWIAWAHAAIWEGISESDTLQYTTARESDDERHIAPLQLATIERCVRLWSNPGEIVLDPFAGIGSVPFVAVRHGRRGIGVELKPSYWKVSVKNLEEAAAHREQHTLFDGLEVSAS